MLSYKGLLTVFREKEFYQKFLSSQHLTFVERSAVQYYVFEGARQPTFYLSLIWSVCVMGLHAMFT